MERALSRIATWALAALAIASPAAALDLQARLAAVRDATTVTAQNSARPTQLVVTADLLGQPRLHATILQYEGGHLAAGGPELHLDADLVAGVASPRDPAQPREFRAGLLRNPLMGDLAATTAEPHLRLALAGLAVDSLARAAGGAELAWAVAPALAPSLEAGDFGLTAEDEKVHLLLASTLQAILDDGGSTKSIVFRSGEDAYSIQLTAEAGSASLLLSGVTATAGIPQAGTVSVLATTLAGDACFAPVLPAGTSRTTRGTCVRLEPGTTTALDLAALAGLASTAPCVRDPETACLLAGRFEVRAAWRTATTSGTAKVMSFGGQRTESDQSVFFYFFDNANFEMGVKMVDACIPLFNDKAWAYVSGLTNQEFTVTIRDSRNGTVRTYPNPMGTYPQTVGDTNAFDCQSPGAP